MVDLIDNSPLGLLDSLAERVRSVLKDSWWYPGNRGDEQHTPTVHVQYRPQSKVEDKERDPSLKFPLVQLVHMEGKIQETDVVTQKAAIYFGGWENGDKCEGWRIPAAMLWAVLQSLLADPFLPAFEFEQKGTEWTLPIPGEEGPLPPTFTAILITTWTSRYPMDETGSRTMLERESERIEFNKLEDDNGI